MSRATRTIAITSRLILLAIRHSSCRMQQSPPNLPTKRLLHPTTPSNGLLTAAKSGDPNAVIAVFGPDSKDIIFSGDPVQDKEIAGVFVHDLRRDASLAQDA